MRSRRSAITLLVVMILVAGALSALERDRTRKSPSPATTTSAAEPLEITGHEVVATLPSDKPVRARVGDSVILRVRSKTPDIAQMLKLGIQTSVGPAPSASCSSSPPRRGSFPVTLEVAGTVGGVVQVR